MSNDLKVALNSIAKGVLIAFAVLLVISVGGVAPVKAASLSSSWAIGVWWNNYSGSGTTWWGVSVKTSGIPTTSGTRTAVVFTSSLPGFIEQIDIDINSSQPYEYSSLYDYSTGVYDILGPQQSVSNFQGDWNTLEHQLTNQEICDHGFCAEEEYLNFLLNGTSYNSFNVYSCAYPCSTETFNLYVVPNGVVESYDGTASDFHNMDVHGYFGTISGSTFTKRSYMDLYSGTWGYKYALNTCSLPSPQSSVVTVGGSSQPPNTVGVTGYHWTQSHGTGVFGAQYEWGIGDYNYIYGSGVYDPITSTNMSSYCNTQMA
jgi:hypothetical protein